MKKVLIIEDDAPLVELLHIHLADLDCQLATATVGDEGLQKALHTAYDLIILDIMLPGLNGFDICQYIRRQGIHTPVLMLTAKSEEIDKVLGLELGADDYLTKPFSIREFIARVKALFRRSILQQRQVLPARAEAIQAGDLYIEPGKRKVLVGNKPVDLTPKEFELLWLLASHAGYSYSRKDLLRLVWGYEFDGYEHTVTAHINRLRIKIEPDISNPVYILTTWAVGYRFTDAFSPKR
jgi:two-component system, OmpR family, alkaline phosphatase synthesis response regulator PhoP